jgi:hypothetical protein
VAVAITFFKEHPLLLKMGSPSLLRRKIGAFSGVDFKKGPSLGL